MPAQEPPLTSNLQPYTVGEISQALKRTIETTYGQVRVRGELTEIKLSGAGHLYFCLKDNQAVLNAVCWKATAVRLQKHIEAGLDAICTGRLTTYPGSSRYQLVVEAVEPAGEGAILKIIEDRRKRLAAEGLFDAVRKRKLPFLPEIIGVITSPTGAVIHDILHRLEDRFPRRVLLWPVAVQGETAAEQIAAAVRGFNKLEQDGDIPRPDILIVARGGGSMEDLMAFNEEIVVRAVAESHIPVITAVGHETDTTLIDFAADLRAPTPTAAAEFAVPVRQDLVNRVIDSGRRINASLGRLWETSLQKLDDRSERLLPILRGFLERRRSALNEVAARLPHPRLQVLDTKRRLDHADERLMRGGKLILERRRAVYDPLAARLGPETVRRRVAGLKTALETQGRHLESVSYHKVLDRGFALVRAADGHPLLSAKEAKTKQDITVEFADGRVDAKITAGK